MSEIQELLIRNAKQIEEYISQNNKMRNAINLFVSYPKIIKVETSKMGNPAYVIARLVELMNSLPNEYEQLKEKLALRDRVMLGMLFWGGVRVSELIMTKKQDLDLISLTWNVRTLKQKKGQNVEVYRPIPLNHVPKVELQLWNKYFEVFDKKSEDLLFPHTRRFIEHVVVKLLGMSPHKLRHAAGLFIYELTQDIRVVSQILRHTNIANTFIYTRLSMQGLREKLAKINGGNNEETSFER